MSNWTKRHIQLSIVCLILPIAFMVAQSTNTDSLRKVWHQQGATFSDAQRLEAGYSLMNYYSKQNYDSLRYFSDQIEAYGRRNKNKKWTMYGLFGKAQFFILEGKLDSALRCYYRALKYKDNEDDELIVGIYSHLGRQYYDLNQEDSAVYYFTKAIKLADKYQHYTHAGTLFGSFGQYYYEHGDYLKALHMWKRGFKHGKPTQKIARLVNIGMLLQEIGLTEDARIHLQEALRLAKNFDEAPSIQVNVYSNLLKIAPNWRTFERELKKGTLLCDSFGLNYPKQRLFESAAKAYLDTKQLPQAEYYLDQLFSMPWVVKTNRGIGAWVLLARLKHQKHRYQQSIQTCNAIFARIGEAQFVKERAVVYKLLYQNYLSLNNTDSALVYLQKSVELETQLNEKGLIRATIGAYLKEKGKLEQTALRQSKEIAELKLQSALSRSRMSNLIFGLVCALLCAIALSTLHFFRQKYLVANRLMSINSTMEQEQQKLKAANTKLLRFSRVVSHDILSNLDLVLSTGNVLLGHKPNPNSLNQYYTMTQTISRQLKDYCLGLLADANSDPGLGVAEIADPNTVLSKVLERFRPGLQAQGFAVEKGELPSSRLPLSVVEQVLQNLVSNALRYIGQTSNPLLQIGSGIDTTGHLCWYVADNGPGQAEVINRAIAGQVLHSDKGQGKGLYLLQNTLQDYGCGLRAEAVEGGGIRMVVWMVMRNIEEEQ